MRRTELDSLRGLAALIVLVYHATAASLPVVFEAAAMRPLDGVLNNALFYSPLRIFIAGPEAVWLFFALSGFVLVKSAAAPNYRWDAYYPSRIVRLYLPVFGAVLVTALVFWIIPHTPRPEIEGMVAGLPQTYTLESAVRDLTLLNGTSIANVPLWSLQWEVLFSLLLPAAVYIVRKSPSFSIILSLAATVLSVWSGSAFLLYMPMFVIGGTLGYHWETISEWVLRKPFGKGAGNLIGSALLVAAICLITVGYSVHPFVDQESSTSVNLVGSVVAVAKIIGIVLLLGVAMFWSPARSLLQRRPLVALGSISFSLYLVHGPIVIGILFLMGPGKLTTVVQILASLIVAVGFYFAVERNAHTLARRIAASVREEVSGTGASASITS